MLCFCGEVTPSRIRLPFGVKKASVLVPNGSYQQFGTIEKQANWNQTEVICNLVPKKSEKIGTKQKNLLFGTKARQKIWYETEDFKRLVPKQVKKSGTRSEKTEVWWHARSKGTVPNGSNPQFGPMEKQANWHQTEATRNLVPWKSKRIGTKR